MARENRGGRRGPNKKSALRKELYDLVSEILSAVPGKRHGARVILSAADLLRARPIIRAIVIHMGVAQVDADDLVQDVVVGAWRSMDAGRFVYYSDRSFASCVVGWLYRITWNIASHHRTKLWRKREVLTSHPARVAASRGLLVFSSVGWEVLHALQRVPHDARDILLSYAALGAKEMATVAKVSQRAVLHRVSHAKETLREVLGMDE